MLERWSVAIALEHGHEMSGRGMGGREMGERGMGGRRMDGRVVKRSKSFDPLLGFAEVVNATFVE